MIIDFQRLYEINSKNGRQCINYNKNPNKVRAVRMLVKSEFSKHKRERDEEKIQELRKKYFFDISAITGISNYLLFTIKQY